MLGRQQDRHLLRGTVTRTKTFLGYIAAALASSLVSASCTRPERSEPGSGEPGAPSHVSPVATSANGDPKRSSSKVEPSPEPTIQPRAPNDAPEPPPRSRPILEADPNSKGVRMGQPLFTCGYANFAWGNVAYGHVLDDQGRIWFYDLGATWDPRPAGGGLYLETGLRERFKNPVLQSRRVPPAQLAAMRRKAEATRGGRIEETHRADDSGGFGCEAYLWERADAYREVVLGGGGDLEIRNSSPEAGHLQEWLQMELGMGLRPRLWRK